MVARKPRHVLISRIYGNANAIALHDTGEPPSVRVVPCRRPADFQKSLLLPARENSSPGPDIICLSCVRIGLCANIRHNIRYYTRPSRTTNGRICILYVYCNCRLTSSFTVCTHNIVPFSVSSSRYAHYVCTFRELPFSMHIFITRSISITKRM